MRKVAKDRLDREFHRVTTEFMTANKQPDYGELQYKRGVFAGIKFLLDRPDLEEAALRKALADERDTDA